MTFQDLAKLTIRTGRSSENLDEYGSKQYGFYDYESRLLYLVDDFLQRRVANSTGSPGALIKESGAIKSGHHAIVLGEYSLDDDSFLSLEGDIYQFNSPETLEVGDIHTLENNTLLVTDKSTYKVNKLHSVNNGRIDVYGESSRLLVSSSENETDTHIPVNYDTVSNPPTKAELTSIYGAPETLAEGLTMIIRSSSSLIWTIFVVGGEFTYEQLSVAV